MLIFLFFAKFFTKVMVYTEVIGALAGSVRLNRKQMKQQQKEKKGFTELFLCGPQFCN